MKPQDVRLGYLMVTSPVANAFIGGLMVVDGRGLPIEFRYSEPIQPTKIQQILYGSVLSRFIKTEVILDTLLRSLESRPDVMIVNDESFLQQPGNGQQTEMIRLTETKAGPLKLPGNVEKISAVEYLLQLTAETSPIRVQMPHDKPDVQGTSATKSLPDKSNASAFTESELYTLLFEVGRMTDILEPIKRVEKALTVLCQEAGLKSATI